MMDFNAETWGEIAKMPTCVTEIPKGAVGVHESCFRAWHLLRKTEEYLERGVPADIVLELIDEIEHPRSPFPPDSEA
jgi:hypothetical protein